MPILAARRWIRGLCNRLLQKLPWECLKFGIRCLAVDEILQMTLFCAIAQVSAPYFTTFDHQVWQWSLRRSCVNGLNSLPTHLPTAADIRLHWPMNMVISKVCQNAATNETKRFSCCHWPDNSRGDPHTAFSAACESILIWHLMLSPVIHQPRFTDRKRDWKRGYLCVPLTQFCNRAKQAVNFCLTMANTLDALHSFSFIRTHRPLCRISFKLPRIDIYVNLQTCYTLL